MAAPKRASRPSGASPPHAFVSNGVKSKLLMFPQVLCDLVCVYNACIRSAAAPPGVPGTVRCAPADSPDTFAAAVQVRHLLRLPTCQPGVNFTAQKASHR